MTNNKLTKRDARKVLSVVDAGLVSGLGVPEPGKMCVEAAICFALGYQHGDNPKCVAPCIRRYKIRINDACWSSDDARTKGMRRAAIAQLGSTHINQREWADYVVEQVIRRILPLSLRRAAEMHKNKVHAERLIEAALRCEQEGSREAAMNARDAADADADAAAAADADAAAYAAYAAYAADAAAAAAAAADAAAAAADAAAYAAYAADAAADAAAAAAAAAAADAAADADAAAAADAAYRDQVLNTAAEICVEACIKCKTQGSKWLDIVDEKAA